MARTKQTARQSNTRTFLATKSSRTSEGLRTVLSSFQAVGAVSRASGAPAVGERTSFLNHENVLGSFKFTHTVTEESFHPNVSVGVAPHPRTQLPETWMSVQFSSKLDGSGLEAHGRPPLNLVIVLDISSSMRSRLSGDDPAANHGTRRKNKLQVAKDCIYTILSKLDRRDQIAIELFESDVHTLVFPTRVTAALKATITGELEAVKPGYGTKLTKGFTKGMETLAAHTSPCRPLNRLLFLTDMESSPADELGVLMEASIRARQNLYTTLLGVDVDLSVGTMENLSRLPGGKYMSVTCADEFRAVLGADFAHDVWPVAFDIRMQLQDGFSADRIVGSSELNCVGSGATEFTISSEFSTPLCAETGEVRGGIILVKLNTPRERREKLRVKASWRSTVMQGENETDRESMDIDLSIPTTTGGVEVSTIDLPGALRKALALVRFVDLQSSFCNSDAGVDIEGRRDMLKDLQQCKESLQAEMRALNDRSLDEGGENVSFMETLNRIIEVEQKEISRLERRKRHKVKTAGPRSTSPSPGHSRRESMSSTFHSAFLCPITKSVMKDPVFTADGHTFERAAIETWLQENDTSPLTGLKLENKTLTPDHALRSLIRQLT